MQIVIYSQKKNFETINTKSEPLVITHLDLKNDKPIQLFGGKKQCIKQI